MSYSEPRCLYTLTVPVPPPGTLLIDQQPKLNDKQPEKQKPKQFLTRVTISHVIC